MMIPPTDTAALILAAGESRRMGSPKPLLPFGNQTALEGAVALFADAGLRDIRVVTGHRSDEVRRRHPDLPVKWIYNDRFHRGMLSSVKKGITGIKSHRPWFFLLPVDIPLVRPRTLRTMMAAVSEFDGERSIRHPTFMGRRGHPPLISTGLIPDILSWDGPGGLAGFLDRHAADTAEIPVIDEFILRDMDTPSDYRSLSLAHCRRHIPTPAECEAILTDPSFVSVQTAAHCRMVARLAAHLSRALRPQLSLDTERITAAAMLHDIAKGEKYHAAAGGALLHEMGYSGIADIVASHMDIVVPDDSSLTAPEVVYLADKLVKGDSLVPLSVRFENKLAKYGHDPSARAAILKRKNDAEAILERMERISGKSFPEILDGFAKDPK